MPILAEPIPRGDKLVDRNGFISDLWDRYFTTRGDETTKSARVLPSGAVLLTDQGASIATTQLAASEVTAGLYRVSYHARVTIPAGTSSSLTVTVAWTDLTQSLSFAGAAITGNLVTSQQQESLFIYVDNAGPVTYATTYVSVGAPAMQYALRLAIERVHA